MLNKSSLFILLFLLILVIYLGVNSPIYYDDDWMDSPNTQDPSLTDSSYLVSTRFKNPDANTLKRPVFIAVHGYSSSTSEWEEFKDYAENNSDALVSLVLMGAHGRNIDVFKESGWEDWGQAILDEYDALVEQGYTDIHLVLGSTAATIVLEYIGQGRFFKEIVPKSIQLVDPFIMAKDPLFKHIPRLGWLIRNHSAWIGRSRSLSKVMYNNNPIKPLRSLYGLTELVKGRLDAGLAFPKGCDFVLFQSENDPTADPEGAKHIISGITGANRMMPNIYYVDSSLHMFTHGKHRDSADWSSDDADRQEWAFKEILSFK